MRNVRSFATASVAALLLVLARPGGASATPQRLNCVLTDTADRLASENRSVIVIFDDAAKTVSAQAGGQNYNFDNVSISNIAISGNMSSNSVGIDRSSFGIVWQQYGADKVTTEFGQCRRGNEPAAAAPH